MADFEFERKFIIREVKDLPFDLSKYSHSDIKQGFYSGLPSPLRIRKVNNEYTLTKKFVLGENKGQLREETIPIKKSEFNTLFPIAYKKIIKTRYIIPKEKLKIEVDIFKGKLKGLIVIKYEFLKKEEMENFIPPEYLGLEITQFKWATNSRLSLLTYTKVKKLASKRGK